jgi:hypothetical protein
MRTKLEIALGRRRWRVKDAELVLAALAESGNTSAEFARRHGLQPKRLQRWQERLAHLESPSLALGDEPEVAPLLPVRVRGTDSVPPALHSTTPGAAPTLDVSVGRGVVHVPPDFDEEHLHRVVVVLVALC